MKPIRPFTSLLLAAVSVTALLAQPIAGPKGGKVVTPAAPHVEFLVSPDRTVVVSFYDQDLKPVPVSGRIVSVIAEAPAGKVTLDFAARDGALASTAPLPAGEPYRVVLQVRAASGARPQNFRLDLNLAPCGECQHAEYACTCEGH